MTYRTDILADRLAHELRRHGGPVARSVAEDALRKFTKGGISKAQIHGAITLAAAKGAITRQCGGTVPVGVS